MDGIGEVFKVLASLCLFLQLAKRWKDSDRDDFLDDFGSENEGDLRTRKLKSPPVQQVRKEEGLLSGEGKRGRKEKTVHRLLAWAWRGASCELLVLLQHTCVWEPN